MAVAGLRGKGQADHPVVRYAYFLPCRVVELAAVRSFVVNGISFCEVIEVFGAITEILSWVACITEGETPSLVESDAFSIVLST